jgi:hypothetical protein
MTHPAVSSILIDWDPVVNTTANATSTSTNWIGTVDVSYSANYIDGFLMLIFGGIPWQVSVLIDGFLMLIFGGIPWQINLLIDVSLIFSFRGIPWQVSV